MHLSKVNEALGHKICGGSEYGWQCWPNARWLDYESEFAHASVVFNYETQEVYVAEVNDKMDNLKPYRWMNPAYKETYLEEAQARNVDPNQAWDDKKWYDLETTEDWLEKAGAIMRGENFDTRVVIPVELSDDEFLSLARIAHERDITFNQLVEQLVTEVINSNRI